MRGDVSCVLADAGLVMFAADQPVGQMTYESIGPVQMTF